MTEAGFKLCGDRAVLFPDLCQQPGLKSDAGPASSLRAWEHVAVVLVLTKPVPSAGLNLEMLRSLRGAQDGQHPAKLPLTFLRAQPLKFVLGNVEH